MVCNQRRIVMTKLQSALVNAYIDECPPVFTFADGPWALLFRGVYEMVDDVQIKHDREPLSKPTVENSTHSPGAAPVSRWMADEAASKSKLPQRSAMKSTPSVASARVSRKP